MLKRFSAVLLMLLGIVVWVRAQDPGMPALPPLPGQDSTTSTAAPSALPPLPGSDSSATSSPADNASVQPALPALPGADNNASAAPVMDEKSQQKEAKKQAKELEKINKARKKKGLDPLTELPKEGESAPAVAPVPATTEGGKSSASTALPGQDQAAAAPVAEAAGNSPTAESKSAAKKSKAVIHKWHAPDFGPNVIFGGMVRTHGGTVEERLAWVSQFVLNGMDFHGYEFQKEEGAYAGQQVDKEWRQFTFQSRKKGKAPPVVIYVEPSSGNSVWLRVGPSEPPAGVPAKEVRRIRLQNQQVLKIMRSQLKGALRPVRGRWEAPYHRTNG